MQLGDADTASKPLVSPEPTGTLGTFGGVFTPSILTILGLVLFLRTGYVVGSVGLVKALLILGLSTAVSVLTSVSLSVVATNMRVRGGGEYYLISRTLGIEFGGAVGVVLYLAITVSIAFYCIGFAEALVAAAWQSGGPSVQLVAAGLLVVLAGVAFIGADLATRLQYLVMTLLVVALVSFFIGAGGDFSPTQLTDNLAAPQGAEVGFWEAFAVFFPAVTGFSQGLAMSGDLKTPSRSITRGTFAAVGLSTLVYVSVMVLLAGASPASLLAEDTTTIMGELSVVEWTMLVGVLAATLSSALASALGAPRVLQRLGEDRVLPRIEVFANGAGPLNNPRRALGLCVVLALATVAAGDINAIAPVISMFFLATYGIINYATYYEITAGSTSFRPRFRWYDHRASLLGTVACCAAIVAINPFAGVAAGAVLVALYSYLRHRETTDRWNDSAGAHHFTVARAHLHDLKHEPVGERDWRPNALVFVPRSAEMRRRLLTISSWLEGGSGFLTAVRLVEGTGPTWRERAARIETDLRHEAEEIAPGTFARVLAVADPAEAVPVLVQGHGIGPLRTNFTIFGMHDLAGTEAEHDAYGSMLRSCVRHGTNVAIVNKRQDAWERFEDTPRSERTIGIWWSDDAVGQLLTLLGWLMQRHEHWRDARLVVHVPCEFADDPSIDSAHVAHVESILEGGRIDAEVIPVATTPAAFIDAMSATTFVLASLRVRRRVPTGPFDTSLRMIAESLPLSALILAAEELHIDAQPDEGRIAEAARARDEAKKARAAVAEGAAWVSELDAKAGALLVEAEALRLELDGTSDTQRCTDLEAQIAKADEKASEAYRKYVDARVRQLQREEHAASLVPGVDATDIDPSVWQRAESVTRR